MCQTLVQSKVFSTGEEEGRAKGYQWSGDTLVDEPQSGALETSILVPGQSRHLLAV